MLILKMITLKTSSRHMWNVMMKLTMKTFGKQRFATVMQGFVIQRTILLTILSYINSPETTEVTDTESTVISTWTGFKLVGDNIDKNLRPSFQRLNKQTILLHYLYAVADIIDFSTLSDVVPENITIDPSTFLSNHTNFEALHQKFKF